MRHMVSQRHLQHRAGGEQKSSNAFFIAWLVATRAQVQNLSLSRCLKISSCFKIYSRHYWKRPEIMANGCCYKTTKRKLQLDWGTADCPVTLVWLWETLLREKYKIAFVTCWKNGTVLLSCAFGTSLLVFVGFLCVEIHVTTLLSIKLYMALLLKRYACWNETPHVFLIKMWKKWKWIYSSVV